jgi:hypothetical protein
LLPQSVRNRLRRPGGLFAIGAHSERDRPVGEGHPVVDVDAEVLVKRAAKGSRSAKLRITGTFTDADGSTGSSVTFRLG